MIKTPTDVLSASKGFSGDKVISGPSKSEAVKSFLAAVYPIAALSNQKIVFLFVAAL